MSMARFLEMVNRLEHNAVIHKNISVDSSGEYVRQKDPDYSSLEEFANDLESIQDDMTLLLRDQRLGTSTRLAIKGMRYKLASYLEPICCLCGESPCKYIDDAWYCERCVKNE